MSQQPDYQPKPNPILGQPATIQACKADYEAPKAVAVRECIAKQETVARRTA